MKKILLYISIVLTAFGCTKDADTTSLGDNALTITSNIATRVANELWEKGDNIGVYMTTSSTFGDKGENVEFTTLQGDGTFTASDSPLYIPSSGDVEIFAYYPYVKDEDLKFYAYPINSENQVDLLSVRESNVTSSSVTLTFKHLLSKISLTIKAGDGLEISDLDNLEIKLSGVSTTATFDLDSNVATTTNSASELKLTTITTKSEDVITNISSSAIVIPQTLSGVTLSFATTSYGTFSATLSTSAFVVGNEYVYTATLNNYGVTITSANINVWGGEDPLAGTASIVDIEYKEDKKYYINSAKGLAAFRDLVNGAGSNTQSATFAGFEASEFTTSNASIYGVLTRNIDLGDICYNSNTSWTPIGTENDKYSGYFDGGGHKVSKLYIDSGSQRGLFGYIGTSGKLYNLGVAGSATCANDSWQIGGIAGWNDGFIINCYSEVNVTGGTNIGGIAGLNDGNVVNCYNLGSVVGANNNVGGIVGKNADNGYVGYCYNAGYIDLTYEGSDGRIGGVVGWSYSSGDDVPTIKGNFCLESVNTSYSIGQLQYLSVSGGYTGNICTADYLYSESFITTINNGSYTYNSDTSNKPPVSACAWIEVSNSYPTLDFNSSPQKTDLDIGYNCVSYSIYTDKGLEAFMALVNGDSMPKDVQTSGTDIYFEFETNHPKIDGKLINDISLSTICYDGGSSDDVNWTPIGDSSNPYSGTFDGCGKSITELYINSTLSEQSLFGYLGTDGVINNLTVDGEVYCHNSESATSNTGGIVAYNNGLIINCCNYVKVSGNSNVGGITGSNMGTIVNSCNHGAITGLEADSSTGGSNIGGITGENLDGYAIYYVYNSGLINEAFDAGTNIGSVVGNNGSTATASGCYTLEDATYTNRIFGESSTIYGSTFIKNKTTMQSDTFVTTLNDNAYSYNDNNSDAIEACAWELISGDYPALEYGSVPTSTN